jgi:hypothetical protein
VKTAPLKPPESATPAPTANPAASTAPEKPAEKVESKPDSTPGVTVTLENAQNPVAAPTGENQTAPPVATPVATVADAAPVKPPDQPDTPADAKTAGESQANSTQPQDKNDPAVAAVTKDK